MNPNALVRDTHQLEITKWLRKELSLSESAPLYFDDSHLVWKDTVIVIDALNHPTLQLKTLKDKIIWRIK